MRKQLPRLLIAGLSLLCLFSVGCGEPEPVPESPSQVILLEIPVPDMATLDPAVQDQLRQQHETLEAAETSDDQSIIGQTIPRANW